MPQLDDTGVGSSTRETWPSESCLDCGACCFGDGPRYLRISGDDHARMADDDESLTLFVGNRCYMRLLDGHCAALSMKPDRADFVCGIYATRPDECRRLQRGSRECLSERIRKRSRSSCAPRDARPVA